MVKDLFALMNGLWSDLGVELPKGSVKSVRRLGKTPAPNIPRPILLELNGASTKQIMREKWSLLEAKGLGIRQDRNKWWTDELKNLHRIKEAFLTVNITAEVKGGFIKIRNNHYNLLEAERLLSKRSSWTQ